MSPSRQAWAFNLFFFFLSSTAPRRTSPVSSLGFRSFHLMFHPDAGSMLAPHWETWSRVLGGGTADTTHYVHWLLRVLRQLGMQPLFKLYSIASKYFAGNTSAILLFHSGMLTNFKHTGAQACDAILQLFEAKMPSIKVAAMYAFLSTSFIGQPEARMFDMVQKSAHNQDLVSFFRGFATNPKAINALRGFFEANYDSINTCLETTFSIEYIVQSVYNSFVNHPHRCRHPNACKIAFATLVTPPLPFLFPLPTDLCTVRANTKSESASRHHRSLCMALHQQRWTPATRDEVGRAGDERAGRDWSQNVPRSSPVSGAPRKSILILE
ncbi:hypothetical protein BGW80DRAFT_1259923 [Lactifluus volemus]|nr:hypothetical protein BGW80DRAFT_1259923 [Lactifluus volemus]